MMAVNSLPQLSTAKYPELAVLKVLEGQNVGLVYSLTQPLSRIGRGEECSVILQDLRASRIHVEILLEGGKWFIRDLGSANGFILNGKIRGGLNFSVGGSLKEPLRTGDKIRIGETLLEFKSGKNTNLQMIPGGAAGSRAPGAPYAPVSGKKPSPLIVIGLGLLVAMFLFDSGPKEKKEKTNIKKGSLPETEGTGVDLAQFLPQNPPGVDRSAEAFVKIGLREYFLGNYMRAKLQFSTALQVDPRHALARLYFDNSNRALQRLVDFHRDQARKSIEAGRNKIAMNHYESVIRILAQEPDNPAVQEAKSRIEDLKKKEEGKL